MTTIKKGTILRGSCLNKIKDVVHFVKTHGLTRKKGYRSWESMKRRCTNKKDINYKNYGGRGISFCKEWETFTNFWADMGDSWGKNLTLDRIDVNGNYCKENCRWATAKTQQNNRRNNVIIKGVKAIEASKQKGIKYKTFMARIYRLKNKEKALEYRDKIMNS